MAINITDLTRPGAPHVNSYWAATAAPEVPGAPPVQGDGDIDTDIAIIGGGYTGLSAAYHLARDHGVNAHVLEAHRLLFYYRLLPDNRILFGARGGIEDSEPEHRYRKAWLERRLREMFPPLQAVTTDYFWHGWVCVSFDKNPHAGTTDDPTVHYALAYMGTGVALATQCGKILAQRLAGDANATFGPLLGAPLPRFPFPGLRRVYQRLAYAGFALQDSIR